MTCKAKQENNGVCPYHNLQCGWPKCNEPEQEPTAWISHNSGLYHGKPDESLNPLPLYLAPPESNQFKPDYNTEAVLVEEMQRMAKRIEDLEAMLERQTARIVELQEHIENFDGEI